VLLDQGVALLQKFNADTSSAYSAASLEEFRARAIRGERLEGIPGPNDAGFAEFVLPKVIAEATDISVIRKIDKWLSNVGDWPRHGSGRPKSLQPTGARGARGRA
jgi:hypothetical protein